MLIPNRILRNITINTGIGDYVAHRFGFISKQYVLSAIAYDTAPVMYLIFTTYFSRVFKIYDQLIEEMFAAASIKATIRLFKENPSAFETLGATKGFYNISAIHLLARFIGKSYDEFKNDLRVPKGKILFNKNAVVLGGVDDFGLNVAHALLANDEIIIKHASYFRRFQDQRLISAACAKQTAYLPPPLIVSKGYSDYHAISVNVDSTKSIYVKYLSEFGADRTWPAVTRVEHRNYGAGLLFVENSPNLRNLLAFGQDTYNRPFVEIPSKDNMLTEEYALKDTGIKTFSPLNISNMYLLPKPAAENEITVWLIYAILLNALKTKEHLIFDKYRNPQKVVESDKRKIAVDILESNNIGIFIDSYNDLEFIGHIDLDTNAHVPYDKLSYKRFLHDLINRLDSDERYRLIMNVHTFASFIKNNITSIKNTMYEEIINKVLFEQRKLTYNYIVSIEQMYALHQYIKQLLNKDPADLFNTYIPDYMAGFTARRIVSFLYNEHMHDNSNPQDVHATIKYLINYDKSFEKTLQCFYHFPVEIIYQPSIIYASHTPSNMIISFSYS